MIEREIGDNRYRLKRLIGTGGTADVYEADDTQLHRTVAIKLLHDRLLQDDVLSARLHAEVQMSRSLAHPGIVEVFDYRPGPPSFLVMEYMQGGDLRKRLLSLTTLSGGEVERISRELLQALEAAHKKGIVHRDLKPRNVLFSQDGTPKIADFGLARSVTAAGLFQRGTIAGTPEYTAPETITSSLWDPRSDLYAAGCTIFEAATGSPPFLANTPAEVLRMQVEEETPPLPQEFASDYPDLARLVELLLQKDPNNRPQTATEALGILAGGTAVSAIGLGSMSADVEPCPSCGASLSRRYGWCFTCGRPNLPVGRDKKGYTILVTGPGKSGEKTKPEFRDACCELTETVGLDSAQMRKRVPRLPFVLARHVDYGGASRLANELRSIGGEATLIGDGEETSLTLLRSIGRKALTMTPRVYLVMLGMGGAWVNIFRSIPPGPLLITFAAILVAIPGILTASFSGAVTKWRDQSGRCGSENVTRMLATVRDPLIHARMKSIAESAHSLANALGSVGGVSDTERTTARDWAQDVVERSAGLCLALDAARSSRVYAENALTDARESADMLRDVDTLYTRTLELVGRSALDIRELTVRLAKAERSQTAAEMGELKSIVSRFGDEGAAWREIRDLESDVE